MDAHTALVVELNLLCNAGGISKKNFSALALTSGSHTTSFSDA